MPLKAQVWGRQKDDREQRRGITQRLQDLEKELDLWHGLKMRGGAGRDKEHSWLWQWLSLSLALSHQESAAFLGLSESAVSVYVQAKMRRVGERTPAYGVVWAQDKNDLEDLLPLWFVLFHDSPQVNASFQEKDKSQEGSALYRRGLGGLFSNATPQLSFPLWGGMSGHGTPLLGSGNQCSYLVGSSNN